MGTDGSLGFRPWILDTRLGQRCAYGSGGRCEEGEEATEVELAATPVGSG